MAYLNESKLEKMRWMSPAKLNLCLYVVGRRADGYHELETLFQLLDFGDLLTFELNQEGKIYRTYDFGFSEEADLCLRAAKLLKPFADPKAGVRIFLDKKIPMGGGLGGGSSNAATVLIALNQLWETGLSVSKLSKIALKLGADVPLFVRGRTAWGSGIGEVLTPITMPNQTWIVVNPKIEVQTAKIFANKRLTPSPQTKKIRALKNALSQNPDFGLLGQAENQLEPIVRAEYPEVEAIFKWLSDRQSVRQDLDGAAYPRMSGSGGAVFMPIASREAGQELLSQLPNKWQGFVAESINESATLQARSVD